MTNVVEVKDKRDLKEMRDEYEGEGGVFHLTTEQLSRLMHSFRSVSPDLMVSAFVVPSQDAGMSVNVLH